MIMRNSFVKTMRFSLKPTQTSRRRSFFSRKGKDKLAGRLTLLSVLFPLIMLLVMLFMLFQRAKPILLNWVRIGILGGSGLAPNEG